VRGRRLAATATLAVALMVPMGAAVAAGSGEKQPPTTQPGHQPDGRTPELTPGVTQPAALPLTGSEVTGLVIAGAMAIGTGTALVRRGRVRKAER
jgi:LPXTG-motif cell wall-anchored protein